MLGYECFERYHCVSVPEVHFAMALNKSNGKLRTSSRLDKSNGRFRISLELLI